MILIIANAENAESAECQENHVDRTKQTVAEEDIPAIPVPVSTCDYSLYSSSGNAF